MTAAIMESDTDVDDLVVEDTEEPIPCVWEKERNCAPAKWKLIPGCCGVNVYYCQACMDKFLELFARPYHRFRCRACLCYADRSKIRAERL